MGRFSQPASVHDHNVIQQLVQTAIDRGALRRQDYLFLTSALLSNSALSAPLRGQINWILDAIRMGRMVLVD